VPRYQLSARVRTVGSVALLAFATLWFFERVLQRSWFGGYLG
jgi:hypothetical protein